MAASNPRAQSAVYRALKSGALVKPDACEECGLPASEAGKRGLHGHHADYDKPLEVRWLCPKCHRAEPSAVGGSGRTAFLMTLPEPLWDQMEEARGETERTRWVQALVESAVGSEAVEQALDRSSERDVTASQVATSASPGSSTPAPAVRRYHCPVAGCTYAPLSPNATCQKHGHKVR
jgi:hypothetical protein